MSNNLSKDIITVFLTVLAASALTGIVAYILRQTLDINTFNSVMIVQSIATLIIISIGGVFAYRKLQIYRDFEPHLTITQNVSHRFIGTKYIHIMVTATLHNSSKVVIRPTESYSRLHQISPLTNKQIETLYDIAFSDETSDSIQWPFLEEITREWRKGKLVIEPGEVHSESYEFVVATDCESVLVSTYFHNPEFSSSLQIAEGWGTTSIHDIVETHAEHETTQAGDQS